MKDLKSTINQSETENITADDFTRQKTLANIVDNTLHESQLELDLEKEIDPIQKTVILEKILARDRMYVDHAIIELFNKYQTYSNAMVNLLNFVNNGK